MPIGDRQYIPWWCFPAAVVAALSSSSEAREVLVPTETIGTVEFAEACPAGSEPERSPLRGYGEEISRGRFGRPSLSKTTSTAEQTITSRFSRIV